MEDKDTQGDGSGKCQVCSEPTVKSCSACSVVYYCSLDHQSKHWTVHKKVCKAYALEKSDDIGRHYVATRNLKEGVIVLREKPVISAPQDPPPELGPNFKKDFTPCCLGCNRFIPSLELVQHCSKCRLNVCSSTCEKMPVHANNECRVFQKFDWLYIFSIPALSFQDIFHLRLCLLKKNNPKAFKALMNLQHVNVKEGKSTEIDKGYVRRMLNSLKILDIVTVEDWIRIVNVKLSNSSDMAKSFTLPNGSNYVTSWQYMCLEATFFAHSCSPNCHFDCIPAPNMKMIVRTATAVTKGEILTIDYYGRNMFLGNFMRRRLNDRFVCKCRRCTDPSEMGSHLSTFVCSTCKAWEMMSTNSLDDMAEWKCNACGTVEEGKSKIALMDQVYKQMQKMDPRVVGMEPLEELISKYSGKVLHPNNWVLISIIYKLKDHLAIMYDEKKELNDEQSQLFISYTEQLISVSSLISPGISLHRANFQHSLATFLLLKVFKDVKAFKLTWTQYYKTLDRMQELYTDCYKFFKIHINTIDGSKCSSAIDIEKSLEGMKEMYSQPPLLLCDEGDEDVELMMKMTRMNKNND